jgi:hypothetical protein
MRTVRLSRKQVCSLNMQCSGSVSISCGSGFADSDPGGHLILDPARSRMHYLWPKILNSSVKTVTFIFENLVRFRIRIRIRKSALQIPNPRSVSSRQMKYRTDSVGKKLTLAKQQNEKIKRNCQEKEHVIILFKSLTFTKLRNL